MAFLPLTVLGLGLLAAPADAGELLYNGLRLPAEWPPRVPHLTREPLAPPPYLLAPPEVIPIDVGRQLFVDDFLIESTTLTRTCHQAVYHPANPVLRPDRPWEGEHGAARAAPFSDGVWFDPRDRLFKLWYWGGADAGTHRSVTCLATSRDGVHWEKPAFDVVPGTNIVLRDEEGVYRNSSTVWLEPDEPDPAKRYRMFRVVIREDRVEGKTRLVKWMRLSTSTDGIHWTPAGESDECADRSTIFYNPFRRVWVYSLRDGDQEVSRCRGYVECRDPADGLHWSSAKGPLAKVLWLGADRLDPDRPDLDLRRVPDRPWDLVPSQLYNLDAVAYESVLLGSLAIWRGQPKTRPKINEVCLGFSRDGFHWTRPDRRPFCGVSEDPNAWNWGNVQAAAGGCLVVGDTLYFYVGAAGKQGGALTWDPSNTGLATLRRDGFVSMEAGEQAGTLTTRKVTFAGRHLFVNLDAPQGRLEVEVLDADGKPIAPFSRAQCVPVAADSTIQAVTWRGAPDLAALAGKPVRFRFHLTNGRLYAFWVSPEANGASHGYVGAGGPGFAGRVDTVGVGAYRDAESRR